MRVGIGYDIHRFNGRPRPASGARRIGRPLKLGGVTIPHARGLAGHSDADVLLHAVTDALLGAVGLPDIGEQFPPGDPRYRQADSRLFVRQAMALVQRSGWAVGNLDATIIADAPRLVGYKRQIREAISTLLRVPPSRISIKAKTTEGFSPSRGGIAAQAVVLLQPARGAPRASPGFHGRGPSTSSGRASRATSRDARSGRPLAVSRATSRAKHPRPRPGSESRGRHTTRPDRKSLSMEKPAAGRTA